jgi:Rps23 Pro-64 3,4-dihydroxylase Tpa1-like proline 4-hydroxylase
VIAIQPVSARIAPFPHAVCGRALPMPLANAALEWFETAAPWRLRIESFYEQYELNLHQVGLAPALAPLVADDNEMIEAFAAQMLSPLTDERLMLVEANAHKLLPGQTIRIHNDFIGGEETHRVLIQINRNWTDQNGGMLMVFSSPAVEDIARLIRPTHGSGMAFEISPRSFHAVSTIHDGERYTLVYSFKRAS